MDLNKKASKSIAITSIVVYIITNTINIVHFISNTEIIKLKVTYII